MFTADLSWSDPNVEKVGERRERKAREQSSIAGSLKTTTSSRSSISADRELWWTSGLKKAKVLHSNIIRPSSKRSNNSPKVARSLPKKLDLKLQPSLKDPTLQPPWTYATTLSPKLPSGARFDLAIHDVPELEGDNSSRRTTSTEARFSQERRWEVQTPIKVETIEEESQRQQKFSNFSNKSKGKTNSMTTERDDLIVKPSPYWPAQPCPVVIEGALSFEALKLHDAIEDDTTMEDSYEPIRSDTVVCPPLSQWACLTPRGVPQEMQVVPKPVASKVAVAHSSTLELTRFQRFIRRMESAGPRVVLDRLKEEWEEGEEVDEELALEKQLWLLTGLQMQYPRVVPTPMCATGKILELYGNLFPLPYPENYFSHIRASTLPSLVPSSKLPELFRECYKLLAPGGLLEIRVMNAAPVRQTAGPLLRMWIDDRLSINLEKLFRCSKPCLLVPSWLTDAGFDLSSLDSDSNVNLPCAFDTSSKDVDEELSTMIGRSLWRDIWGSFVDDVPGEVKWFWEDASIMEECLKRKTVFECQTILACKR
ncbi:hypothetical protein CC86DRAFT_415059 [Ophiobolus disseminans]|uniref:Methyltransferase type 11 domain-containing protein n=1 Tax=Ophiobolus disseminans TaxID=1469910 RepID=A0A6A7AL50_9PLEO|nr:hypothetical protein CC86DRAFT_415059 [Ophiobolus disseminans]